MKHKNRSDIKECLKNISTDKQFFLSSKNNLYEYQNRLLDLIKGLPSGDSILVRETSIQKGKNRIVIWFTKGENDWIVVDNLEISPNVSY